MQATGDTQATTTASCPENIRSAIQRVEVFEDDKRIFFTYDVDEAYLPIVKEMAEALFQHDSGPTAKFPTGNDEVDSPYLCRADDALRVSLPLLRAKIADEISLPTGNIKIS